MPSEKLKKTIKRSSVSSEAVEFSVDFVKNIDMLHYVCYLKKHMLNPYVLSMLSNIFEYGPEKIGELTSEENCELKFENVLLDGDSEFNSVLTVYVVNREKVLKLGIYNSLLFGLKVSSYMKDEVIVSDESDDPYQWILIRNSRIFWVEELATDSEGITLLGSDRKELSYDKALALLPGRDTLKDSNYNSWSFSISPSSLWNSCIKTSSYRKS